MSAPAQEQQTQTGSAHPAYRPDIDGLRAVAVLSVVIFHAFPSWLAGGFAGVDIFFVISGFLISSIIMGGLDKGRFSSLDFYERRVKRIFPALLVVLSCSAAFGWWVLLSDEFHQLGRHLAAGAGFVSNLVLWSESGYFDAAADVKPLLHLWSLGIEEQFYIIWPVLLWCAARAKVSRWWAIVGLAALSFTLNVYGIERDGVATFYSPLTRFWELLVGAALAQLQLGHRARGFVPDLALRNLCAWAGAALLALAFALLHKGRAFPGWWAVLPTVGAALLIFAGPQAWFNRTVLSHRVLVWFGLISFPLYLWHWPLLSFAHILHNGPASRDHRIALVVAAVVLAWATYRFIEKPIRFGGQGVGWTRALVLGMVAILSVGGLAHFGVLRHRIQSQAAETYVRATVDAEFPGDIPIYPSDIPKNLAQVHLMRGSSPQSVVFWGDSHVQHYVPRIAELYASAKQPTRSAYFASAGACPPILHMDEQTGGLLESCDAVSRHFFQFIERNPQIKTVVLGAAWNAYFIDEVTYPKKNPAEWDYYIITPGGRELFRNGRGRALAMQQLEETLRHLARTRQVYLLLDNPQGAEFSPRTFLDGNRLSPTFTVRTMSPTVPQPLAQQQLRDELKTLARRAGVSVIDPVDTLCTQGTCLRALPDGTPLYRDTNHLRSFYVKTQARFIDPVILAP